LGCRNNTGVVAFTRIKIEFGLLTATDNAEAWEALPLIEQLAGTLDDLPPGLERISVCGLINWVN
jgi:hypothetical protein